MALQRSIMDIPMEAAAQLYAGCIVKLDNTGRVVPTSAATDLPVGAVVSNNGSTAPFQCVVRIAGIVQVQNDGAGAIAPGDRIGLSALTNGRAIKDNSTLGTANKKGILGVAMTSTAATAGLLIDVLIRPELMPST